MSPRWDGKDRRQSSPAERDAYKREHPPEPAPPASIEKLASGGRAGRQGLLITALTVIGTLASALVYQARTPVAPEKQDREDRSDGASWRKLGDIESRLTQHITKAEALEAEWRRDQQDAKSYREKDDDRARRIEGLLTYLVYKSGGDPRQIGEAATRDVPSPRVAPMTRVVPVARLGPANE